MSDQRLEPNDVRSAWDRVPGLPLDRWDGPDVQAAAKKAIDALDLLGVELHIAVQQARADQSRRNLDDAELQIAKLREIRDGS